MRSVTGREGYLFVDHRASPGLPEEIARLSGYDPRHCGEGKLFEGATLTCAHCKVAVVKNPLRQRERPYCPKCDHYVCDLCAFRAAQPDYSHTPFDKIIDQALRQPELGTPRALLLPPGSPRL